MNSDEARRRFDLIDATLEDSGVAEFGTFERDQRRIHLYLTGRLRQKARKAGCWGSPRMLTAIGNAAYGFDSGRPRSRGGADGIYLVDRGHRPVNAMMRKLFGAFLDRPDCGADALAASLGAETDSLLPVRLVSHHMRLLGVLHREDDADHLALVDLDVGS